jgi:multidrug resistance protein
LKRPSPIIAIFLTVFIDLMSFGLVIPDVQVRADSLGAKGWQIGAVIAIFSLFQLLLAPLLGRMSDRLGRRPILLITCSLAVVSFLVYSQANELWIMFVARAIAGVAGANLGVAFAYAADISKPEDRAKALGLLGAAFGLGFILGPVIGGQLIMLGGGKPFFLGIFAACLALVNFFFVLFFLPESWKPTEAQAAESKSLFQNLKVACSVPALVLLLLLFLAYNLAFTNLESTYFLLATQQFQLTIGQATYILATVGVVSALMQGFFIRYLTPKFGEVKLLRTGFLLQIPALILFPFALPWVPQLAVATLLAVGTGLSQPSLSSLISRNAPRTIQGGIFGITQSLGAMVRIIGPILSNTLYSNQYWLPYAIGATILLVPAAMAFFIRIPDPE